MFTGLFLLTLLSLSEAVSSDELLPSEQAALFHNWDSRLWPSTEDNGEDQDMPYDENDMASWRNFILNRWQGIQDLVLKQETPSDLSDIYTDAYEDGGIPTENYVKRTYGEKLPIEMFTTVASLEADRRNWQYPCTPTHHLPRRHRRDLSQQHLRHLPEILDRVAVALDELRAEVRSYSNMENKMFLPLSPVKIKYCGEPP